MRARSAALAAAVGASVLGCGVSSEPSPSEHRQGAAPAVTPQPGRARTTVAFDPQAAPPAGTINVLQDLRARANAELGEKVVGGKPVPAGALLAIVGVTYGSSRSPGCTGTLIGPNVVLTAAHCVCGDMESSSTRVRAVFVGNDWSTRTGPKAGLYYPVSAFRSGIAWPRRASEAQCQVGLRTGRDLAVLKLSNPVRNVRPVGFAPDAVTSSARSYRVAGFGAIDENARVYPEEKYEARVVAVSNACRGRRDNKSDADFYGCLADEEIVAGNRLSPDSCNGDSGGPLLVTQAGTGGAGPTETFLLAGATSRAINSGPPWCGQGGIYERLTPAARKWIADNAAAIGGTLR